MDNKPPKLIDRSVAWGCLMTNLLVLPGLGTWLAGHRARGVVQAILAVAGLLLMMVWVAWFLFAWLNHHELPGDYGPSWLAVLGTTLFMISLGWSLLGSARLIRKAPK